ncbi:hypothetical protein I6N96_07730 [Enterococcus sp. BWM-S5]|uniref:Transposase n=1 Tax=Enterococcus larvae TaxID=2794352 RepID=A0ABS4CHR5_9ENTE|nr:hypothetical protein [Enterococcus larvae]MBP1046170.1 hypothetical protein [Enterococcus larvae]
MFKNENQEITPNNNFKIPPFSIDPSGQKVYRYQHGKTTIFVKYKMGGESLETLLLKHFIGVINAEK